MDFRSADSVESNQNPLGVTYSNHPLPPVQNDGGTDIATMSFTIPEMIYAASKIHFLKQEREQGTDLFFLPSRAQDQTGFEGYVRRTYSQRQFSSDELNVKTIIDRLFDKTLQYLIDTSNPPQSTILYRQFTVAKENEPRAGMEGVCFTPLQVDALIAALDSISSQSD
ncbi:MAG: hypothetical protein KDK40_04000 [Chlamydiia bacterium]|nr:hypothetical protein [Chlamydiia bacterium]